MSELIYIHLRGALDDHLLRLSQLSPAIVLSYLAGADWTFVEAMRDGDMQLWAKYDEAGHVIASVGVPMVRDVRDYEKRLAELFRVVAVVDKWPMTVSLGLPAELREACG